uniref:Uncharacterized protein n=1 Tax=Anguilla anguilla TaxID=7936 RepID=A0A0E9WGQ0_ANGAN
MSRLNIHIPWIRLGKARSCSRGRNSGGFQDQIRCEILSSL